MDWCYLNDNRYYEICSKKAYCEMDDDEIRYCIEAEKKFFISRIKKMFKDHWTLPWIAACIRYLYENYLIFDDFVFYKEFNIGFEHWSRGLKIYENTKSFNFDAENPLIEGIYD